jgi:hypothetical protein
MPVPADQQPPAHGMAQQQKGPRQQPTTDVFSTNNAAQRRQALGGLAASQRSFPTA